MEVFAVGVCELNGFFGCDAFEVRCVSRGGVVGGDGETEGGIVVERDDVLYAAFAVGCFADEGGAFEIVEGTCGEFGCGGRVAVDKNCDGVFAFATLAVRGFEEFFGFVAFAD